MATVYEDMARRVANKAEIEKLGGIMPFLERFGVACYDYFNLTTNEEKVMYFNLLMYGYSEMGPYQYHLVENSVSASLDGNACATVMMSDDGSIHVMGAQAAFGNEDNYDYYFNNLVGAMEAALYSRLVIPPEYLSGHVVSGGLDQLERNIRPIFERVNPGENFRFSTR